ncbi:uncharacterized protein KD926_000145 [Aspergillus affinis]|uniref:uncharacterized protein n=1 Tax=Aspergillus affinis TaxID=1070780 RepID=UPI0022FEAD9F|nr:uncharacterized protein KD926_000145 [Aspergillus affinis]KAI9037659.1 hypothetical protein KD926_000145 [Aspergillus affinis]
MMLSATIPLALISLASFASAWHDTAYDNTKDCGPGNPNKYQIYYGTDTKTCHNFDSGDSHVKFHQYWNGGEDHKESCKNKQLIAASVRVRHSKECRLFKHRGRKGVAEKVEGEDCFNAAIQSFACNTQ